MSRPVQPWHLEAMADRVADSARDRAFESCQSGIDTPAYRRAVRAHHRQRAALSRLTRALERRLDGLEARR